MNTHFGIQLHPQYTTWPALRDCALLVEQLGYDSLWTWDHLMAHAPDPVRPPSVEARPDGPNFEGWQVISAWAALTVRIRIGMLVSSNPHRHPALLAKMAATLDHVSGGRAMLGLGAGGFEFEKRVYGFPDDPPGVRLAKLDEAAAIIRSLLEQPRTTFSGQHYQLSDAPAEPKPIQQRVPFLIAGGGERKTLRIVARYADLWHGVGTPEILARKLELLRGYCAEVGRDPASIVATTGGDGLPGFPKVLVRDSPDAIADRLRDVARNYQMQYDAPVPTATMGTPNAVAERLAEYWHAGVRTFLIGMPSPFDRETIERVALEVRPRLATLVGATV